MKVSYCICPEGNIKLLTLIEKSKNIKLISIIIIIIGKYDEFIAEMC